MGVMRHQAIGCLGLIATITNPQDVIVQHIQQEIVQLQKQPILLGTTPSPRPFPFALGQ